MSWLMLSGAITAEVTATAVLRHASASLLLAGVVVVLYAASYACLALALRRLDLSVAYAVWCAVGIAAIAAIGVLAYHERLSPLRLLALALIVAAVVILTLTPQTHHQPAHARRVPSHTVTVPIGVSHARVAPLADRRLFPSARYLPRHAR